QLPHPPLDALELFEDEAVLGDPRQPGLPRELLRQAACGGHRIADLVRDARRQLAERGELLGVRERALDRDRTCEQVRAVEQEGELGDEGLEPLDVVLVEEAAQHPGVQEEVTPAAARAQDRSAARWWRLRRRTRRLVAARSQACPGMNTRTTARAAAK